MAKKTLTADEIRALINKKQGSVVSFDLNNGNVTDVVDWIPTGNRWLDSIIAVGKKAGIPVGKIIEIAGLEHTGKSFLAAFIAKNAQDKGINVVWFDSEMAVDSTFLENIGIDLNKFTYIPAQSVEKVFETIELLLTTDQKYLFVWDSLALTPTETEIAGGNNPNADVARKARVINLSMSKVLIPIARQECTLLVLNHLKDKIGVGMFDPEKYITPGGKTLTYAYALRIWLTLKKGKSNLMMNQFDVPVGSESKVTIMKSRFGTYMRTCVMKMIWGSGDVKMGNEELWVQALEKSDKMDLSKKGWGTFKGTKEYKFPKLKFEQYVNADPQFKKEVEEEMDQELIFKFKTSPMVQTEEENDTEE